MKRAGHLLRVLGIAFGWAIIVGNTIGAGILRAPGDVAQAVPSYTGFFMLWLIGGAYALLGALSLAELGAMIPESGGQTVFVRRAFGHFPGFAVAWSDWLSSCASAAAVAIVLTEAITALVPALSGSRVIVATAIIIAFAAGQWRGVKTGSSIQVVTSCLKAFAFLALIVACFLAQPSESAPATTSQILTLAGVVAALQVMIFTYDGWTGALYFSGEINNPGRDIPRAMVTGVLSVLAIYLLLNLAFVRLIPLNAMAGDPMVADTASRIVFGSAGSNVIRLLIVVSLLSTSNSCLMMASRVLYAMGATNVNRGGTPTVSLAVSTLVTVAFVATGTFNQVIALAAFFFVANYAVSFLSVFWLRRSEPRTERPYRAWGYPVTTGIVLVGSVVFLVAAIVAEPRQSGYALLLLAVSYPASLIMKRIAPTAAEVA